MTHLTKLAINNPYQGTLPPTLFSDDKTMLPHIREWIIREITKVYSPDRVSGVYMVGSFTSYRWSSSSDIDITVAYNQAESGQLRTHGLASINNQVVPTTPYRINFYTIKSSPQVEDNYLKADTNVYDLLQNKWLGGWKKIAPTRPTEQLFPGTRYTAQLKASIIAKLKQHYQNSTSYNRAFAGSTLFKLSDRLQQDRRDLYQSGWGIPRYGLDNYMFKTVGASNLNPKSSKAVEAFLALRSKWFKQDRPKLRTYKQFYA